MQTNFQVGRKMEELIYIIYSTLAELRNQPKSAKLLNNCEGKKIIT